MVGCEHVVFWASLICFALLLDDSDPDSADLKSDKRDRSVRLGTNSSVFKKEEIPSYTKKHFYEEINGGFFYS